MSQRPSVVYGKNFARLRQRASLSQEDVARSLGYAKDRNANVSSLEVGRRSLPKPATVRQHAEILKCETWELMDGVVTDYDQLRRDLPRHGSEGSSSAQQTEGGSDVPASGRAAQARIQQLTQELENQRAFAAAAEDVARRLLADAVIRKAGATQALEPGRRSRGRKAG